MEIRKIFKTGNSLVLALPADFLKELELAEGDHVSVGLKGSGNPAIVIQPLKAAGGGGTLVQVEDFLENYREALDKIGEK